MHIKKNSENADYTVYILAVFSQTCSSMILMQNAFLEWHSIKQSHVLTPFWPCSTQNFYVIEPSFLREIKQTLRSRNGDHIDHSLTWLKKNTWSLASAEAKASGYQCLAQYVTPSRMQHSSHREDAASDATISNTWMCRVTEVHFMKNTMYSRKKVWLMSLEQTVYQTNTFCKLWHKLLVFLSHWQYKNSTSVETSWKLFNDL